VCLSVRQLRCAKMTEQMDVLFGVKTVGNERHTLLDENTDIPTEVVRCDIHQITLASCFGKFEIVDQLLYVATRWCQIHFER